MNEHIDEAEIDRCCHDACHRIAQWLLLFESEESIEHLNGFLRRDMYERPVEKKLYLRFPTKDQNLEGSENKGYTLYFDKGETK